MASDRLSFATAVALAGPVGAENRPPPGEKAVVDPCAQPRRPPGDVHLTSGLSYACRYCGRAHYPTCR